MTCSVKRIAVFASGNGSNAENLIKYFITKPSEGQVVVVVTNKADAPVVGKAIALGTPVEVISRESLLDSDAMAAMLDSYGVDMIVLAGFLWMIPAHLIRHYRIVNLHPSLLPRHGGKGMYGRHVHEAVVAAGDRESGITIHEVTERCDEGEIYFQTSVEVLPEDTPADVEVKIHLLEKEHLPHVIEELLRTL